MNFIHDGKFLRSPASNAVNGIAVSERYYNEE
jgi:hypothetical protein